MCHHHASDWFAETHRERENEEARADEELTGPGFNEPAIETVRIEEPEIETPDFDGERSTSGD